MLNRDASLRLSALAFVLWRMGTVEHLFHNAAALLNLEKHIVMDDSQPFLGEHSPADWRLVGDNEYLEPSSR